MARVYLILFLSLIPLQFVTAQSKIEYYFDYIGKPVPSHFKFGSYTGNMVYDVYEPPDNNPTFGREIMAVGVKKGQPYKIVEIVSVYCRFNAWGDLDRWLKDYITKARELGFGYVMDYEKKMVSFSKEGYSFVHFDSADGLWIFSGRFEFKKE